MAQNTFVDGAVLTASQINTYLMGEGGAWTSWTPTVTQSGSVTVTNTRSRYARYGRTIHFTTVLTVTGTGTSSNSIVVSLPMTAAGSTDAIGGGALLDNSSGNTYTFIAQLASTTTMNLLVSSSTNTELRLGAFEFTAALAANDLLRIHGTYEAAS